MNTKICPFGYPDCSYLRRRICNKEQVKRCKYVQDVVLNHKNKHNQVRK